MQKISKRLKAITKYIPPYTTLADIGTDHAYLIIYAMEQGLIYKAQAIDNKPGPLASAKKNCIKKGLEEQVEFTLASGLHSFNPEMEVVVIAGMGANTIIEIIEEAFETAKKVKRLILQANTHLNSLRIYLDGAGFEIEKEEILEEKNKFYEIIQVRYTGRKNTLSRMDYLFGPKLRKEKTEIFLKKTQKNYKEKLKQFSVVKFEAEKEQLQEELNLYEEVLHI